MRRAGRASIDQRTRVGGLGDGEQRAERLDRVALPAFAGPRRARNLEVLARQVEQWHRNGRGGAVGDAQVEPLMTGTATRLFVSVSVSPHAYRNVGAVPEPQTHALLLADPAVMAGSARRRRA